MTMLAAARRRGGADDLGGTFEQALPFVLELERDPPDRGKYRRYARGRIAPLAV